MILYDLEKILKYSNNKVGEFFNIFTFIVLDKVPKSPGDYRGLKYYDIDFSGKSFLINPEDLLKNAKRYTKKEIVEYIILAARRPLGAYLSSLDTSLDRDLAPINIPKNRLIRIEDNRIYFLYETKRK
jgi:hypothetical protein